MSTNSGSFIIAAQLNEPGRFHDIFGEAVVALAREDLKRGFGEMCEAILTRYQILADVVSPTFGRWYLRFTPKPSSMSLDMDEQIPVLMAVGEDRMRELLLASFGRATGAHQEFRLAIFPCSAQQVEAEDVNFLIDRALSAMSQAPRQPAMSPTDFQQVLAQGLLETYFQPIVSLQDGAVAGYEALTRGPQGSSLCEADRLFGAARQLGLTGVVEMICLKQALSWVPQLPEPLWIAINLSPELLMSPAFRELINDVAVHPWIPRIVFELTEHLPLESALRLRTAIDDFRRAGLRLSLDDTGCGFFDISTVEALHPEIVKLCITVVSRIGRSAEVENEMRETIARVARLHGSTLGEGVETAYQAEVLRQCGARYAQGFHFGRPRPARELFPDRA